MGGEAHWPYSDGPARPILEPARGWRAQREVDDVMWYWGGGMQWWGWLLGAFGMVVFWGLVIWGLWYLVTNMVRRPAAPDPRQPGNDPRRILDERLARGDIDADEYRRLRDLLSSDRPAQHAEDRERAGTADRH